MTYFFDLDGTLISSVSNVQNALRKYLAKRNIELTPALWQNLNAMGYFKTAEYFIRNFGITQTAEEIVADLQKDLLYDYANEIAFKPYAKEYLERLKKDGNKLYIVSASPLNFIFPCLENNGVREYFDEVISVEDFAPYSKKDVELYHLIAKKLGVNLQDVVYVEDGIIPITTGKKTAMTVYAVKDEQSETEFQTIAQIADKIVYDYKDLL